MPMTLTAKVSQRLAVGAPHKRIGPPDAGPLAGEPTAPASRTGGRIADVGYLVVDCARRGPAGETVPGRRRVQSASPETTLPRASSISHSQLPFEAGVARDEDASAVPEIPSQPPDLTRERGPSPRDLPQDDGLSRSVSIAAQKPGCM